MTNCHQAFGAVTASPRKPSGYVSQTAEFSIGMVGKSLVRSGGVGPGFLCFQGIVGKGWEETVAGGSGFAASCLH